MTIGISSLLILVSLYFIKKASKKKSKIDENGNSVHQLPLIYGIGGIVPFIISLIIIVAIVANDEPTDSTDAIVFVVAFSFLGLIMCLMTWMNKVTLNSEEITQRNMWGKTTTIKMNEIKSIRFSRISLYLKISDDEKLIKCHDHLVGIEEILDTLSEKTGMTRSQMGYIE